MNPKVDWFFNKDTKWQEEYSELRMLILNCGLSEELKWGCPCYTFQKENVVLIHGFKDYCALSFTQGALLKDEQGILIQQTKMFKRHDKLGLPRLKKYWKVNQLLRHTLKKPLK